MARFRWNGNEYKVAEHVLVPEMSIVERAAGMDWDSLTGSERGQALALISLRRARVAMTWEEILRVPPGDFELVGETAPVEDPTAAVEETAKVVRPRRTLKDKERKAALAAGAEPVD